MAESAMQAVTKKIPQKNPGKLRSRKRVDPYNDPKRDLVPWAWFTLGWHRATLELAIRLSGCFSIHGISPRIPHITRVISDIKNALKVLNRTYQIRSEFSNAALQALEEVLSSAERHKRAPIRSLAKENEKTSEQKSLGTGSPRFLPRNPPNDMEPCPDLVSLSKAAADFLNLIHSSCSQDNPWYKYGYSLGKCWSPFALEGDWQDLTVLQEFVQTIQSLPEAYSENDSFLRSLKPLALRNPITRREAEDAFLPLMLGFDGLDPTDEPMVVTTIDSVFLNIRDCTEWRLMNLKRSDCGQGVTTPTEYDIRLDWDHRILFIDGVRWNGCLPASQGKIIRSILDKLVRPGTKTKTNTEITVLPDWTAKQITDAICSFNRLGFPIRLKSRKITEGKREDVKVCMTIDLHRGVRRKE